MLNMVRFRFSLLATLVLGLALAFTLTSLSPATASAATAPVTHQVSGKVTAKASGNFTLLMSNNVSATFAVTPNTKYFQGGKPASFAAMEVGMQISAEVTYDSKVSPYYIATYVSLPTPPPPCYTSGQLSGKVTALTATSFTVASTNGGTTTFLVSGDTKFYLDGKASSFASLKVGMSIQFTVKSCGDGKYTAVTVNMTTPPPPPACYTSGTLSGKVTGKTADTFSIIWANGEASKVTFAVNSATKFYLNGKPATFADLKAGQYIQFIVKSCGDGKYTAVTVYLTSPTSNAK